ncbi:MAG: methyltransferase, partial [Cyclobacteriaceae bacterium]
PRVVRRDDAIMYILEIYRDIIFWGIILCVVLFAFFPDLYQYLLPVSYLQFKILKILGLFILVGALIFTRAAQIQLKSSYRIGFDRDIQKAELITTGLYSKSRNPIAVGLLLVTIGYFLVIPNMVTFCLMVITHLVVVIRVRLEEEHMQKLHGSAYSIYKTKTPRWFKL